MSTPIDRQDDSNSDARSDPRARADSDGLDGRGGGSVDHTSRDRSAGPGSGTAGGEPAEVASTVPTRETVLQREKDQFGGMKFGSAFFGWLTATGLAVLVLALLTAAGVAFGLTSDANIDQAAQATEQGTGTARTVGLIGGIVLLVLLFVAYFCGGYVAGRMARFNGTKQGLAVWLWAIVTTAVIAGLAAIAGSEFNILSQLNLPRIPVDEGSVTTAGIIAVVAALLAALAGALVGGATGTRYHRRVDAAGFDASGDDDR